MKIESKVGTLCLLTGALAGAIWGYFASTEERRSHGVPREGGMILLAFALGYLGWIVGLIAGGAIAEIYYPKKPEQPPIKVDC
jgi:hypothetical protein